jgi:CHASE1-domain containing sensor protein
MLENKADVPVSAPQTQVAQLEATIRSAHALLQAGLIDEATSLLAAFSNGIQPNIGRSFIEYRPIKRGS